MSKYGRFTGKEEFTLNGKSVGEDVVSFWSWAYSELDNNIVRSVLAEYVVASALGITKLPGEDYRQMWRPFDLMYNDKRIEVKSASNVQSWDVVHKGKYTFSIAPASLPDPVLGYVDGAPKQRNSDFYVFALFEPENADVSPLNLDAWRFLILPTKKLDDMSLTQKTIGIHSLMNLKPRECRYGNVKDTIDNLIRIDIHRDDCIDIVQECAEKLRLEHIKKYGNQHEKKCNGYLWDENAIIEELDIVALRYDRPDYGLNAGTSGTIVSIYGNGYYMVELPDENYDTDLTTVLVDCSKEELILVRSFRFMH